MTDDNTIIDAITENAAAPKKMAGDGQSVEEHPLPDQIAAAEFVAANRSIKRPNFGIRRVRMIPPGNDC